MEDLIPELIFTGTLIEAHNYTLHHTCQNVWLRIFRHLWDWQMFHIKYVKCDYKFDKTFCC